VARDNDCKDVIVACVQIGRWLARCETMVLVTLGPCRGVIAEQMPGWDGEMRKCKKGRMRKEKLVVC